MQRELFANVDEVSYICKLLLDLLSEFDLIKIHPYLFKTLNCGINIFI